MSESNDENVRKSVSLLHESNQNNKTNSERKINRLINRYNQVRSFISTRNEMPTSFTRPSRQVGRSISLSDDKILNNTPVNHKDLITGWITNTTNQMKDEKNEKMIEKIEKEFEVNFARLILVQLKQSENNQEIIKQIQLELENIKRKLYEFSDLYQTWQILTERKFQEIIEISEKHENEIDYLKQLYQNKLEDLQQQLDQLRSNSLKIRKKETNLLRKTKTIFKRKRKRESSEKIDEIDANLMNYQNLSILQQTPLLSWEIIGIHQKIQNRQEIWSKYFQTIDKKFTMRLWIHFNGVANKSSINIELLVWNNCQSMRDKFIYEEDITIIISNKTQPYCFESISKRIRIDETTYSSIINVKYSNLIKNKILESDSIIIRCQIDD